MFGEASGVTHRNLVATGQTARCYIKVPQYGSTFWSEVGGERVLADGFTCSVAFLPFCVADNELV